MTATLTTDDPLLSMLAPSLRRLAERGVRKRFRKGQLLIVEGDYGDTLFIILEGRVRVFGSGDRGRELTYGTYGAGEYLGEISLDGGPRSASVEALETCDCAVVTRTTLLGYIREYPEFSLDLLTKVIRRARAATLNAKQLALNDVYGRMVLLLNELAVVRQADGTRQVPERITHKDLASRLGCSREMVSRLLKDLETGGYVAAGLGRMVLLKPLPMRW